MTWNYRVVKTETAHEREDGPPEVELWWSIHEVYYEEDGVTPRAMSSEPTMPIAYDDESELRQVLEKMLAALDKPTLNAEDF